VRRLDAEARSALQRRLHELAGAADELSRRRESWINDALSDVRSGRANTWQARGHQVGQLIERANPMVARLGVVTDVAITGDDTGALVALARSIHTYLSGGGKLKINADGTPKIGAF
jgi:hypothetical protein